MLTFAILLTLSQILAAWLIFSGAARRKSQQEHKYDLLRLQLESLKRETEHTRESIQATKILRHDLRHHYLLIYTLLSQGEKEKALEHIEKQEAELCHMNDSEMASDCK